MLPVRCVLFFVFIFSATAGAQEAQTEAAAEEQFLPQLNWVQGPDDVDIARKATIRLKPGYTYLGADDTKVLMELMENPSSGSEYYVGPEDMRWFAVFAYDDSGHIKDDEEIDSDALLASVREGTEAGNRERRKRGWAEMQILGWQYEPFYEKESNRLAWAILAESEGIPIVNYNTRLLGRTGVMSATLVADPETLDEAVAEFGTVLEDFEFNAGQRYAEFQPGDKVAKYGLAALVAGGAAAAVAKSGAGKGLFKMIGIALIALFAGVATFFKRLFGKKDA